MTLLAKRPEATSIVLREPSLTVEVGATPPPKPTAKERRLAMMYRHHTPSLHGKAPRAWREAGLRVMAYEAWQHKCWMEAYESFDAVKARAEQAGKAAERLERHAATVAMRRKYGVR